jgi:hypothetical protein
VALGQKRPERGGEIGFFTNSLGGLFSLSWSSQSIPKAIKPSQSALLGDNAKQKRIA